MEHALAFARFLVNHNHARVPEALLDSIRFIIVPVVNPDGLLVSQTEGAELQRKNCRAPGAEESTLAGCVARAKAHEDQGVDLNRNYPAFWGGDGSGVNPSTINARGAAPQSEPETQNILELLLTNQIAIVINVHSPDGRVLTLPSALEEPPMNESELFDSVYAAVHSRVGWNLGSWTTTYERASGTMDETAYYATGALPFTIEIGDRYRRFQPPFEDVVKSYYDRPYGSAGTRTLLIDLARLALSNRLQSRVQIQASAAESLYFEKRVWVRTTDSALTSPTGRSIPLNLRIELGPSNTGFAIPLSVNPSSSKLPRSSLPFAEQWTVTCLGKNGNRERRVLILERGDTAILPFENCN